MTHSTIVAIVIYILIIGVFGSHQSATGAVEFNSKEACLAARAEIIKVQNTQRDILLDYIFCAAKGEKK